jgi:ubiquilin
MSSGPVPVKVQCSNQRKFSVDVDPASTVEEFKRLIEEQEKIPAGEQRLIYKGRVLKNELTLGSYGR